MREDCSFPVARTNYLNCALILIEVSVMGHERYFLNFRNARIKQISPFQGKKDIVKIKVPNTLQ